MEVEMTEYTDGFIEQIKQEIKRSLGEKSKQSISHMWDHGERVWKRAKILALKIMEKQEEQNVVIDMETLEIAAHIHDIDQSYEEEKTTHVINSITVAEAILTKVNYPEHRKQKALQILSEHSSEIFKMPSTPEAKILFDADKLDGLGAIGIARVFAFCGQRGLTIKETVEWYRNKIKKAAPLMQTKAGKKLAASQLKYVLLFLKKIEEEEKLLEAI